MEQQLLSELHAWFLSEGIDTAAAIPFSRCRLIQPRKLHTAGLTVELAKSVLVFTVPYFAGDIPHRNLSIYAAARDYHLYFRDCVSRLCAFLHKRFPTAVFCGFADNSPIDEVHAAAIG